MKPLDLSHTNTHPHTLCRLVWGELYLYLAMVNLHNSHAKYENDMNSSSECQTQVSLCNKSQMKFLSIRLFCLPKNIRTKSD